MTSLRVHHVSIDVIDAAACTAFYTAMLDGTVRDDRPNRQTFITDPAVSSVELHERGGRIG